MSEALEREVACLPSDAAACVLPYDPARDEVVLIEQFRPAVYLMGDPPWSVEAVAGLREPGEATAAAARREAREEAGLDLDRLEHVLTYYASPGAYNERTDVFVGLCDAARAGGVHGADAEHEDIRVRVLPFDDAFALLRPPAARSVNLIVSLQWLALNRERLRGAA